VPTPELNRFVQAITATASAAQPRPPARASAVRRQTNVAPPTFVFFTNVATSFHFSYERFLLNQIRDKFGFARIAHSTPSPTPRSKGAPESAMGSANVLSGVGGESGVKSSGLNG
jgi:hypothetical protein